MDRRTFVRQVSGAAAGVGCGALLTGCAALPYVEGLDGERGVTVLKADLAEQRFVLVETRIRTRPVFLSVFENGFRAVSTRCSHRGCAVAPEGELLECPCHGSRFEFDGTVLNGPADRDLERFEIEDEGDRITILVAPR